MTAHQLLSYVRSPDRECSKGVDPLVAGEAVLVNRYELPDGHPLAAPAGGHPCD